jgi:hypothetical protein
VKEKKINVGISVAYTDSTNIWNSGLNQNLAFLVLLLRHVPEIGEVFLLDQGAGQLPASMGFDALGVRLVKPADVTFGIDLVIEVGASLPLEWLRHVRALGARIVTFFVGNSYVSQAEPPVFQQPGGTTFVGTPWHEIWTLPQHAKTSAALLECVGRVPVHIVPHIWSPIFLRRQAEELALAGHHFGFRPETARPGWRAAIFEPNISVVKSCVIPMLACDHAFRTRPQSVQYMMVLNSMHMKEHTTFNRFASHLELTRAGKASFEPRIAFAECMAVHGMNAVVSHQWENSLNYAYYDALYGGYPLVHNSDVLRDAGVGIHYPGFEAKKAGQALVQAWEREPGTWSRYRDDAMRFLRTVAPDHAPNVAAFRDRIATLMEGRP